jgi:hypothetical protein
LCKFSERPDQVSTAEKLTRFCPDFPHNHFVVGSCVPGKSNSVDVSLCTFINDDIQVSIESFADNGFNGRAEKNK